MKKACALLAAVAATLVTAAGSAAGGAPEPPAPPPAWTPPATAFDLRVAEMGRDAYLQGPQAWCPTGRGFLGWLSRRAALSNRGRLLGARNHTAGPPILDQDGVFVLEDDGTVLNHDNIFDLEGWSVEVRPTRTGRRVTLVPLAWESDFGTQLFQGARNWRKEPVDLTTFAFPLGVPRTTLWVTSSVALFFEDPDPPGSSQFLPADVVLDRTPRVAPLQQGTSFYGWDAWVRQDPDRIVFTWEADGGDTLDVQAVLFPDGSVRFNYRNVGWPEYGAAVVTDGDGGWWADVADAGRASDDAGDVTLGAPDGPPLDLLELRAGQVSSSEILQLEVDLAEAPPPATDGSLWYVLDLRDGPDDPDPFRTDYLVWEDGRWTWTTAHVEAQGTTLRVSYLLSELPVQDGDVHVTLRTWQNTGTWQFADEIVLQASLPAPPEPVMLDLSRDLPVTRSGPVFEAFTLPELNVWAVWSVLSSHMRAPRFDSVAIYQDFKTDLKFYAGGYSTVGNAGADGIGTGSSADPEFPGLLHLDQIRTGWNGWDGGKAELLNHEFGHHWLYFFRIQENGAPTHSLNPDGGHPAGWVATPAAAPVYDATDCSCMGGSDWADNGDGTFTSPDRFASYGYTWHELYLMGLADPIEVPGWWYIQNSDPGLPSAYWPGRNVTVSGTRVPVSLGQLTAVEGPRYPTTAGSRKDFAVPMVLVVRPGQWNADDVAEVARTCEVWAPVFSRATASRATVRCAYNPPNGTILTPAGDVVVQPGGRVSFTGAGEDADGDAVTLEWDFAGAAPAATGEGPHDVVFDTPGVFDVILTAVDATGMYDESPAVVRVTVPCVPPAEEVRRLQVAREGEGLRFHWQDLATAADDYLLLSSPSPAGPFEATGVSAASGDPGALLDPAPQGRWFFEVPGRNLPDCVGPY